MTAKRVSEDKTAAAGLPRLIDLHFHAGWTDFEHDVQLKRSPEEIRLRRRKFLEAYGNAGIRMIRDAGGMDSEEIRHAAAMGVSIVPNAGMLSADSVHDESKLAAVLSSDAEWVKIFITGGVGVSKEDAIVPTGSKEDFAALIGKLHAHKKKIMVHCYGGKSLDWCIECGVETVEHGVYMTREQAAGLAENGIAFVPTTSIYRLLSEEPELFGISEFIRENAKKAADAHMRSVKYALSEGVTIGYGTDFYADPALLRYAGYELETLADCGLSSRQTIDAGTVNAGKILGIKASAAINEEKPCL